MILVIAICRRDDIEAVFYTLIALLRVKLPRVSAFSRKQLSDADLLKALGISSAAA
jgi:hypothetical protein